MNRSSIQNAVNTFFNTCWQASVQVASPALCHILYSQLLARIYSIYTIYYLQSETNFESEVLQTITACIVTFMISKRYFDTQNHIQTGNSGVATSPVTFRYIPNHMYTCTWEIYFQTGALYIANPFVNCMTPHWNISRIASTAYGSCAWERAIGNPIQSWVSPNQTFISNWIGLNLIHGGRR